jgi:hypothetical protein
MLIAIKSKFIKEITGENNSLLNCFIKIIAWGGNG